MRASIVLLAAALTLTAGCLVFDKSGIPIPPQDAGPDQSLVASFIMTPDCTTDSTTPINFVSRSTDPDGDTLTCSWIFSSGTPDSSTQCTANGVTFPSVAPYTITLTVENSRGETAFKSRILEPCP